MTTKHGKIPSIQRVKVIIISELLIPKKWHMNLLNETDEIVGNAFWKL